MQCGLYKSVQACKRDANPLTYLIPCHHCYYVLVLWQWAASCVMMSLEGHGAEFIDGLLGLLIYSEGL